MGYINHWIVFLVLLSVCVSKKTIAFPINPYYYNIFQVNVNGFNANHYNRWLSYHTQTQKALQSRSRRNRERRYHWVGRTAVDESYYNRYRNRFNPSHYKSWLNHHNLPLIQKPPQAQSYSTQSNMRPQNNVNRLQQTEAQFCHDCQVQKSPMSQISQNVLSFFTGKKTSLRDPLYGKNPNFFNNQPKIERVIMTEKYFENIVKAWGFSLGNDKAEYLCLINKESAYKSNIRTKAAFSSAQGLGQVVGTTSKAIFNLGYRSRIEGINSCNNSNCFRANMGKSPMAQIEQSMFYLNYLMRVRGNFKNAIKSYYGSRCPSDNETYYRSIKICADAYRKAGTNYNAKLSALNKVYQLKQGRCTKNFYR
jgi:hypothetical protein